MNDFQLEAFLEQMAFEEKRHFSPHYFCAVTGIADLKFATEYLLFEAKKPFNRKLNVFYEVECPEGDSDFTIDSPDHVPNDLRVCQYCGTAYFPDPRKIWIAFDFTKDYTDFVKKKSATKMSRF